jgi:hypothetical protein
MIDTYTPIEHWQAGQSLDTVFMVDSVSQGHTRENKPFIRLTLKDVTGTIEGNVWGASLKTTRDLFVPGEYIRASLALHFYQNQLQFKTTLDKIQKYRGIPENIHDYVLGPNENVLDVYQDDLSALLDDVDDAEYRDIIGSARARGGILNTLRTTPYGLDGPLAYRGGLMIHTLKSTNLAMAAIEDFDATISRSLVVAGCLFRNIGWATTTFFEGNILRPKDAFYMTGLYRASARYVDHTMLNVESDLNIEIPEGKKQALHNLCNKADHINTVEGRVVAQANYMVDILQHSEEKLRKIAKGNWRPDHVHGIFVGHHG